VSDVSDVLVIGGIFREVLDGANGRTVRYGGSGLTAAVAASRLGAWVTLAGAVGREDAEAVDATLAEAGVEAALIVTEGASGTFVFPEESDSRRPWPMYRPSEGTPHAKPALSSASIIVCFGVPDLDPIAEHWLDGVSADTLVWDKQGWLSRARDNDCVATVAAGRRIYLANMREAMDDADVSSPESALDIQPPAGFDASVIKDGDAGIVVIERHHGAPRPQRVPPFSVVAASTIGSGDVFAGALAASLADGSDLGTAARAGCAAAAVAIGRGNNLLQRGDHDRVAAMLST
jgi:ribokinase